MIEITAPEAQQRLPVLLSVVAAGEQVRICADDGRTYVLAAVRPRPPVTGVPKAGRLKSKLVVPPEFDEPAVTMAADDSTLVVNCDWPAYPHPGSAEGLIKLTDDFDGPAGITTDEGLCQALVQLGRMHRALTSLRENVLPKNERWFAVMAEGPLDEIRKLVHDVTAHIGRHQAAAAARYADAIGD
jgi:antitoxin (DNA-binding transcriptional repressor) of toxin-antitoxin stability system